MFNIPVYFIIFPDSRRKLCFSKAQVVRVLQYEGWSRPEARETVEMSSDVHPGRWGRAATRRDPALRCLALTTTVGKATLAKLKTFWKTNATDLGGIEPRLPVLY